MVTLSVLLTVTISASMIQHQPKAEALKELGLFKGSDKGFELERAPSRVEAMVMLVRLLGKEEEAKENNYEHPFTDVPEWANVHIAIYIKKI
jgi:hypothetical protein